MKKLLIVLAVAALLALAACGPTTTSVPPTPETPAPTATPTPTPTPEPEPEIGTVEVRATDAPADGVSKIMVSVSSIEVHRAGADDTTWQTVVTETKTFDLVEIEGAEILLGTEEIAAGTYTQIRLNVDEVTVTLDGEEVEATLPGEKLKVVRNWEVKADDVTVLTLDFDANSFVVVTGQGRVQVKPVIKLEVTHGEKALKEKPEPPEEPENIPHTLGDRDVCSICHATDGIKPVSADHEGRPDGGCTGCHQPGVEETAPVVEAARIGHTLDGRDICLNCHAADKVKPNPEDHAGRAEETCIDCHQMSEEAIEATQTAKKVMHSLAGRDSCLNCHDLNKSHPFPEDHFGRLNESCLVCHKHF